MTGQQIIELIRAEERQLYIELGPLSRMYGWDNKSTKYASEQWMTVLTILDKIQIMNKEEILELIRNEEAELYFQLLEQREMYGVNDRGTRHTGAQWNAITTILDKIEENEKAN